MDEDDGSGALRNLRSQRCFITYISTVHLFESILKKKNFKQTLTENFEVDVYTIT